VTVDPDSGEVDFEFNPKVLQWGGSIQYSMPYLRSAVVDLDLADFINHLIPVVEFSLQTPVANTLTSGTVTTGTISPGVIWVGNYFQVGVEALIPVNRQSGSWSPVPLFQRCSRPFGSDCPMSPCNIITTHLAML
jgi:hypothetical protein